MSFQHGAGFRVCGAVVRRNVAPSGKCAFLTLDVVAHPRSKKIEFKAFSNEMIEEVGCLGVGQTVEVTGQIDMESIKSKDRKEVLVDGRARWAPSLVIKAIKVEGASVRPAGAAQPAGAGPHEPPPPRPRGSSWDDVDDSKIF